MNIKKHLLALSLLPIGISLFAQSQFVNPMIGTGGHGHVFPGATRPMGMVQLSPDNKSFSSEWDFASGYHISDTNIVGFSHTHLSGTGVADLGDILLMPYVGENPLKDAQKQEYASGFSHQNEKSAAGYYSVFLNKPKVMAELTSTEKVGFHRYTFPESKKSKIIIDLYHKIYWGHTDESQIYFENDSVISGYKMLGSGWQRHRKVYFVAKFSKPYYCEDLSGNPITKFEPRFNRDSKVKDMLCFTTKANEQIMVKVAISMVSLANARENLKEIPDWNFDKIVDDSKKSWDNVLSNIQIEGTPKQKEIFYTALYHSMIAPNQLADNTGEYMGPDYQNHKSSNGKFYSTFSLWDTYRAAHPLYTLIISKQAGDMVNSMMEHYQYNGYLPMWTLWGSENHCMIANHSIPVIYDAILKGIYTKDLDKVLDAMVASSTKDHTQSPWQKARYEELGYYAHELEHESVSKTLESAYNDWCVAQLAKKLNKMEIYDRFSKRSLNYKNLFHPTQMLMIPKNKNGEWKEGYVPTKLGSGDVTEGNSWQYTWSVQHDIEGLKALFGGTQMMTKMLDSTFNTNNKYTGEAADVTGLIGQYAHGNEPSHHTAYLYNYLNKPWKTQQLIKEIINTQYNNTPDGICGNEDCGQMSAWYIFSALGFYPTNPASGKYDFGSPQFPKSTIKLDNGKTFVIVAKNVSEKNFYIQSIKLNGKPYTKLFITHQDILNGGMLEFEMGNKPQTKLENYQY